jgi:hypothetical protein
MLAQDVFTCSSKCCKRESLFRFILNRGQLVLKTPAGLVGRARLPHLGNEGLWPEYLARALPSEFTMLGSSNPRIVGDVIKSTIPHSPLETYID